MAGFWEQLRAATESQNQKLEKAYGRQLQIAQLLGSRAESAQRGLLDYANLASGIFGTQAGLAQGDARIRFEAENADENRNFRSQENQLDRDSRRILAELGFSHDAMMESRRQAFLASEAEKDRDERIERFNVTNENERYKRKKEEQRKREEEAKRLAEFEASVESETPKPKLGLANRAYRAIGGLLNSIYTPPNNQNYGY